MRKKTIQDIRAFNRWYTDVIGLLNRHLLDSDYSLAEARLIFEINKAAHIQASQLMEILHIDKSYLSRILQKLEKDRVVAKKRSPEDARAVLVALTDKGQREFAALNNASDEQIVELLHPLTEEQREELVDHMNAIMNLLTTK
jgi:DNA-binding MarR family transcriptional regulator